MAATLNDKQLYIRQSNLKPLIGKKDDPFTPVKKGYGFYGTLLHDSVEDKIQCHVCGEMYVSLTGHVGKKHKLTVREYKESFELNYGTKLVTPSLSQNLSKTSEFYYKLNHGQLTSNQIDDIVARKKRAVLAMARGNLKKARIKRHTGEYRYTIETMNKYGTCPVQIEERFLKVIEDLGHTPSYVELKKINPALLATLEKRFKGYSGALFNFGLKAKKGKGLKKYGISEVRKIILSFVDEYKRLPNSRDTKAGLLPDYMTLVKYFGNWWKVKEFAFTYLRKKYPKYSYYYDKNYMRIRIN